jgi:hypothetical protein
MQINTLRGGSLPTRVDGRVERGHDDEASLAHARKMAGRQPSPICLDKIRNIRHRVSLSESVSRLGPAGRGEARGCLKREKGWLNHNRRASREVEESFFIPIARNPLKSPDSKK